jgi:hypothetical protein
MWAFTRHAWRLYATSVSLLGKREKCHNCTKGGLLDVVTHRAVRLLNLYAVRMRNRNATMSCVLRERAIAYITFSWPTINWPEKVRSGRRSCCYHCRNLEIIVHRKHSRGRRRCQTNRLTLWNFGNNKNLKKKEIRQLLLLKCIYVF